MRPLPANNAVGLTSKTPWPQKSTGYEERTRLHPLAGVRRTCYPDLHPPLVPIRNPQIPPPRITRDPELLEAQVYYALHSVRACLGEPVEVTRAADNTISVRATLVDTARLEQLKMAKRNSSWTAFPPQARN